MDRKVGSPRKALEVVEFAYTRDGKSYPVRLVTLDDEPWFLAADIVDVTLGLMLAVVGGRHGHDCIEIDYRQILAGKTALSPSRGGAVWLISERAFYEAVYQGQLSSDEVRAFKEWVTHAVLPTFRELDLRSAPRTTLPVIRRHKVTYAKRGIPLPVPKRDPRQPHGLYRFFDAADQLLYVGITWHIGERVKKHRVMQPWWFQVARMQVEFYPTRRSALAAERVAIRTEKPLYNIADADAS